MTKKISSQSKFNFYVHGTLPAYSKQCLCQSENSSNSPGQGLRGKVCSAQMEKPSTESTIPGIQGATPGGQQFLPKARDVSPTKTHHNYVWKPSAAQPSL